MLVADTKWKVLRESSPADDDLKQMFVYNELFGAERSLLVYPAVDAGAHRLEGEYVDRAHRCGTVELGLFEGAELGTKALVAQIAGLLGRLQTPEAREVVA
jgi:5-methylcytosine-specific restriction endonuclease McrBC regulatory subunit McrC